MTPLRHTMILASAGSGKTHALTNRYVALLARGVSPERIVALTFTRKAAGEFFDEILNKLARAAAGGDEARRLARAIGWEGHSCADFLAMLRTVVDAMPVLRLGTLDGFFARIVRSFPLELGLSGEFDILQEHAAMRARRRVLRSLFAASDESDKRQSDFIEAFKRATFGAEEKQLSRRLDSFLDEHAETYLAAPNPEAWGRPGRIWPDGCAWLSAQPLVRENAWDELRAALPWDGMSVEQRQRFADFFSEWKTWRAGAPMGKPLLYIVDNAFKVWGDLSSGRASLTVERRKVSLSPDAGRVLRDIILSIGREEIERRIEMTRGLHAVLRGYEQVYHDSVRRGGRLTFADVQRLLLPGAGGPTLHLSGPGESREELRLAIDWRLDAEYDHWLLDEFQDTSFGQWSILRNLIDEAVQDPEGRRSFFYVGDVKQAIYSWREGDPRLFREIFNHYNAAKPGAIEELQLNQSWRSGPEVIRLVNRVFGDRQALATVVPAGTAAAWSREWREHTSAHPGRGGHVEVLCAADKDARFLETLRLLREIDPLARGLTVALLVQKNDTAAELANYLRTQGGLRAVAESDITVCTDNPLGAALLALVRAAAFPGDSLAWEHVQMTPLAAVMAARGIRTQEELTLALIAAVHEAGFAGGLERWIADLETRLDPADEFSRSRARDWFEAAHAFDETGSRDFAEFLEFAERHVKRDGDSPAVVRVMTVHKAKGLGFDLVVLPDLEGGGLGQRRRGLAVRKAADRSVEWVLDLPPNAFVEHDAVLGAYKDSAEEDAAYESLCVLYVAMTRAKRAMYVIVEPVGNSKALSFPRLLREAVGESHVDGNPLWYESIQRVEPVQARPGVIESWLPADADGRPALRRTRLATLTPSGTERALVAVPALFDLEPRVAAEFGTAVHALFAEVEWSGDAWRERVMAKTPPGEIGTMACAEMIACMEAGELGKVFRRPPGAARADLWRERAFEVILDGVWVTGVFDRVVIERDEQGAPLRVRVWDFKTDRVSSRDEALEAARRYAGQIEIYRKAAARLTGLELSAVTAALVFTRIREFVEGNAPS